MAGETSSGAADRSDNTETGRTDDPWRRIETEKPHRDTARRAWDAEHASSPEFEYAIRPLGDDYGRDRPKHRELTDEQRAELEEVFGRPADEILALREKDPRAGHNRDDQGRILGPDGQPRPEKTPEEVLREAQRQANLHGTNARSESTDTTDPSNAPTSERTDRQSPSEQPANADGNGGGDAGGHDRGGDGGGSDEPGESREPGEPEDPGEQTEPNRPQDLAGFVGEIAAKIRSGEITPREAADQLEQFRDRTSTGPTEPTTETVRTEQTADGERRFERGTPVETADTTGERIANEESDKVSPLRRKANAYWRSSEGIPNVKDMAKDAEEGAAPRLPPGTHGETTIRHPDIPTIENRGHGDVDAGNVLAAALALTIASVVTVQRARDKIRSMKNQQEE